MDRRGVLDTPDPVVKKGEKKDESDPMVAADVVDGEECGQTSARWRSNHGGQDAHVHMQPQMQAEGG